MKPLLDTIRNKRDNALNLREFLFNILSNICKHARQNNKQLRRRESIKIIKKLYIQKK